MKLITSASSPSLGQSQTWPWWQWSANAARPPGPMLLPSQKAPELSSHLRQDTAVADTQLLLIPCQCKQTQGIYIIYIPPLSTYKSTISPHHGHMALPPQEETCRRCPRAACVSKPIHPLRGTDPPLVVTFRCYGARESCFPQQASTGSSHPPLCCSYSLTPAEGNSLG